MSDYSQPLPDQGSEPQPPSPRRKRTGGWMGRATFICSALALILAGTALYLTIFGGRQEPEEPPEPITFQYRDRTMEVVEGIPVNAYNPSGFSMDDRGRISYEQGGRRAKQGIDVSFYQGEIDWGAVAADGVEFAILRLGYRGYTEGGLQFDSAFQRNILGALDAGLEVGVYFFSQAITEEEAVQEAEFVLSALEGYSITYPVAFDWEYITPGKGARTDGMDGQTLTRCAAAFCRRIAEKGYTPVVYFNQDLGYLTYYLAELIEFPFWLAEYDSRPDFYYQFALWQYTHSGTVDGIQGNVDWNLDFRPVLAGT